MVSSYWANMSERLGQSAAKATVGAAKNARARMRAVSRFIVCHLLPFIFLPFLREYRPVLPSVTLITGIDFRRFPRKIINPRRAWPWKWGN
jgi:hypothetical protein